MAEPHRSSTARHEPAGLPSAGPPVAVELVLPVAAALVTVAADAVTEVVREHQRALAVPGGVAVSVRRVSSGPWRMRVDGRRAGCAEAETAAIVREATRGGTEDLATVPPEHAADVVGGLCTEALQTRLSVLLHPAHVATVLARAGVRGDDGDAAEALARVLDSGVALGPEAVAAGAGTAAHPVEMAERVIDAGRSTTIDVLLAPATLRALTSGGRTDTFPALRAELYAQAGILGPDFHLRADPTVPEGSCAFTANAVRTWPRRLSVTADPAGVAEPLGRLLRRRAGWFLSTQSVQELGDRLALVLPDTVAGVRARYPLEWLTAVARAAAEEGMSLRNLATLLDRLLDIDVHPPTDLYQLREGCRPPAQGGMAALPRPRDAVVLLRQRMREEASRSVPAEAVEVHRLSPELEARAEDCARTGSPRGEDADVVEDVVGEVRRMTGGAPQLPLVAPSLPLRSWLWEELRGEFPSLDVVALTEYPPGVEVVTVPAPGRN